jgi:hypothetical protein
VIRTYIEDRFGEKAARRTTEEFLADLVAQTGTPLAQHSALLRDFLEHCELPKFARYQLSIPDMEAMYESAKTFLLNTGPVTDTALAGVNLPPVPTSTTSSPLVPAK